IEVNGSQKEIELDQNNPMHLNLGILKINLPQSFPMMERLQAGGQPIFAYINEKVLFNLNTEYPIFAGKYQISLEGSEMTQDVEVIENGKTQVKTLGAKINAPGCPAQYKKCKSSPKITIHSHQLTLPIMNVETNIPFVVFDQNYQYGVEGVRGILRTLPTSNDSIKFESLVRIKLKWEVKSSTSRNNRTSLARFEARGLHVFGRSLDLLFAKPEEVYLPEGAYDLAYYVDDINLDKVKNRIDFSIASGETREFVIPVYSDNVAQVDVSEEKGQQDKKNQLSESKKLPYNLSPILN
ncbi:MAG: hypothetical protein K2X39_09340, partial [Silvanigrellaceae bacterium]|nr:hypothetical protein [Silvanigrellaceae bacterium]